VIEAGVVEDMVFPGCTVTRRSKLGLLGRVSDIRDVFGSLSFGIDELGLASCTTNTFLTVVFISSGVPPILPTAILGVLSPDLIKTFPLSELAVPGVG
jgi:hypothetical protein